MADSVVEIESINFRQVFPWLHLFRCFRIAVDPRKLLLAALALVALAAGDWVLRKFPEAQSSAVSSWETVFGVIPRNGPLLRPLDVVQNLPHDPGNTLLSIATDWSAVLSPVRALLDPAARLFRADNSWWDVAQAWSAILWTLLVWSMFGGAITRMAAVQFAKDQTVGIRDALKFSGANFLSYLYAPLLPMVGLGFFWFLCLVGGGIGRTPMLGDVVLGVLWIIPLVFALLMSLLLVGVAIGWPLMFSAISTEGSDGFDGLSRSYSYIYERPWYLLWLVVVALAYGSAVIFFVSLVAQLTVYLAAWSVASGMGLENVDALLQQAPETLGGQHLLSEIENANASLGTIAIGFWLKAVALLLSAFVHSYFWSVSTAIYFLLRRSDDGNELTDVFVPSGREEDELLPLVASDDAPHAAVKEPPPPTTSKPASQANSGEAEPQPKSS